MKLFRWEKQEELTAVMVPFASVGSKVNRLGIWGVVSSLSDYDEGPDKVR